MAGPHVVGAVALLWSANPKLIGKIKETTEILTQTATPKTDPTQTCGGISGNVIPNNTYGYGLLNVEKAVTEALHFSTSNSNKATHSPNLGVVTTKLHILPPPQ
jgi:hypothetical protein